MLALSRETYDGMLAHAVAGLPNEACGLFAATFGTDNVVAFYPMTNAAASESIYEFDGAEHLAVEKQAEEAGLTVVGVMHSHTASTAYPSPTDVAQASRFDPLGVWHHVIVSLKHPAPALRSYRIVGRIIEEEAVQVLP
ncbi:MAG: M67 family metallopeptidase [bacterium]|nr:M67 family metallopeptidase [bacterium]MCY3951922.1 M67 family metallopeptidase [bacterium]MCY4103531.1 M67 family metallopeptidase [bacterium]